MTTAENKAIVQKLNESIADYFRTGDFDALLNVLDPNAALKMPGMPPNAAGLKEALPMFRTAFPDLTLDVGEMIAEGDLVAYRATWTATHTGEFMGIPPTNRRVTVTETHIDRVADGKVIEHSGDWDQLGMLQQIGAIPAPQPTTEPAATR